MARAGPKRNEKAKAKKKRLTPEEQHARFVEAAKKAEADETPQALDRAFNRVDLRKKESTD